MSDHLLILSDDEARLLGSLYSLGAMAVLSLSCTTREKALFEESRKLVHETLGLPAQAALQGAVRDKLLELIEEMGRDAEQR